MCQPAWGVDVGELFIGVRELREARITGPNYTEWVQISVALFDQARDHTCGCAVAEPRAFCDACDEPGEEGKVGLDEARDFGVQLTCRGTAMS